MSFFDDEGDEPPTRTARRVPRPAARAHGGPPDAQQLMIRRGVLLGVVAVILILIIVLVNGCVHSQAQNALRDYNRNVAAIVSDSDTQVSKPLFDDLVGSHSSALALSQNVNSVAAEAQDEFNRAKAVKTPGDMKPAQTSLLEALSLRLEGVNKIAADVSNLSGNQKRQAVKRIAADMRLFLASDVLFSQRVDPYIRQVLGKHKIEGQTVQASQFLPDDTWLSADTVGARLGISGVGQTGKNGANTSCPSLCGHSLDSVSLGSTTLTPGTSPNHVNADKTTAWTVSITNGGSVDEFAVKITITLTNGTKTVRTTKTIGETKAGEKLAATLRFGDSPPPNPVRATVTIAPVAGETNTTNNTATYIVYYQ